MPPNDFRHKLFLLYNMAIKTATMYQRRTKETSEENGRKKFSFLNDRMHVCNASYNNIRVYTEAGGLLKRRRNMYM